MHGWSETGFLWEDSTAHQLRTLRLRSVLWFRCVTLEYLDCLRLRAIVNLVSQISCQVKVWRDCELGFE
jgi:hypothetical protein